MCQGLGPKKQDEISEIDRYAPERLLLRRSVFSRTPVSLSACLLFVDALLHEAYMGI